MTQHPLSWIKRVSENLAKLDKIPLFGHAPLFDWRHLASLLAERLRMEELKIHLRDQKWCEGEEIGAGLGPHLLVVPITLSPLPHPLYWAMARKDLKKFTSLMLNGQAKGKSFSSDILQEGYYRFLLLEVLDAAQGLAPIQEMTLHLGEESPLPEGPAFCIDVELRLDGQSCWGRLILTAPMRKAWIHHFSAFPSEYAPTDLSRKLEMVMGVKTGSILLHQKEWKDLKKGDFLILDQGSYDAHQKQGVASLMLGETPLFHVKIKQNKIELTDYAFTHEDTMQEQKSTPAAEPPHKTEAAEEETMAIKDLPLHVTVELARVRITLDQLMNLSPGNMLDLPIHPDQGVSLTVNGQKVGRGELVYLGETLGVRILDIG